jgi:hypothetical protein
VAEETERTAARGIVTESGNEKLKVEPSRMQGNLHVRFLEGMGAVKPVPSLVVT